MNLLRKIFYSFHYDINPKYTEYMVDVVRILTALLLFIRYYNIGISTLDFYSVKFVFIYISILFLTGGFLVKGTLLFLIFGSQLYDYSGGHWNLANMVTTILLWCLFFIDTNTKRTIDYYLINKIKGFPKKNLLIFSGFGISSESFTYIRIIALFMFGAICVDAVSFHMFDKLWLEGNVLQLMLRTPYLSDFYSLFNNFSKHYPRAFNILCMTGLYVQLIWELAMIPLSTFKWGRIFVFLQGMLFFSISLIFINVSYLPWFELLLWLLIFPLPATVAVKTYMVRLNSNIKKYFLVTCLVVCTYHMYKRLSPLWGYKGTYRSGFISNIFGQKRVDVFNKTDLGMGQYSYVIYNITKEKLVPFMDYYGGRLSHLRNDWLYFNNSLALQRFSNRKEVSINSEITTRVINNVLRFDYCHGRYDVPIDYKLVMLRRNMISDGFESYNWSEPEIVDRYIFTSKEFNCNNLPRTINFLHFLNGAREKMTLQKLKASGEL